MSAWLDVRTWLSLIGLLVNGKHTNPAALYALISTNNSLSDKTLFMNLGYWAETQDYDEACYALARVLAAAAEMNSKDDVLDAGFGFGEQDIFWARTVRPASIVGLNTSRLQVETACERVKNAGVADRVRLVTGSATAMPIADHSVTKVIALESAFHCDTRQQFFEEAFRVLKPGGRIALADLLLVPAPQIGYMAMLLTKLGRVAWQIPAANTYSIDAYANKLRQVGFTEVQVRSIREQVLRPFRSYIRGRFSYWRANDQMSLWMKILLRAAASGGNRGALDYVLVSATRP